MAKRHVLKEILQHLTGTLLQNTPTSNLRRCSQFVNEQCTERQTHPMPGKNTSHESVFLLGSMRAARLALFRNEEQFIRVHLQGGRLRGREHISRESVMLCKSLEQSTTSK